MQASFWMVMNEILAACRLSKTSRQNGPTTIEIDLEKLEFLKDEMGLDLDEFKDFPYQTIGDIQYAVRNGIKEYFLKKHDIVVF